MIRLLAALAAVLGTCTRRVIAWYSDPWEGFDRKFYSGLVVFTAVTCGSWYVHLEWLGAALTLGFIVAVLIACAVSLAYMLGGGR